MFKVYRGENIIKMKNGDSNKVNFDNDPPSSFVEIHFVGLKVEKRSILLAVNQLINNKTINLNLHFRPKLQCRKTQ